MYPGHQNEITGSTNKDLRPIKEPNSKYTDIFILRIIALDNKSNVWKVKAIYAIRFIKAVPQWH